MLLLITLGQNMLRMTNRIRKIYFKNWFILSWQIEKNAVHLSKKKQV